MEYTSLVQSLKKSLSSTLAYFYPLAGRLKKGESGRTEIDFTEGGVEFKEASIIVPFEHLEKDRFRHKSFFQKLTAEVDQSVDENYSRPLLSIQVFQELLAYSIDWEVNINLFSGISGHGI